MFLKEYLFVDRRRLQSYYQQINEAGVTAHAVPVWSAGVSLAGPKAEVTRQVVEREPTEHAMVRELRQYLEKHNLLNRDCFGLTSFSAVKVTILSTDRTPIPGRGHLTLWISDRCPRSRLYLIEDCDEDDQGPRYLSGFGALGFLLSLKFTRSALAVPLGVPKLLKADLSPDADRNIPWLPTDEAAESLNWYYFERDPIGFLGEKGACVGDPRRIEALWRLRWTSYYVDSPGKGHGNVPPFDGTRIGVMVGYPIYIAVAENEELGPRPSRSPH